MSQVEIDDVILKLNLAQSNAFPAEPIAVLNLVNVSIDAPVMEEGVNNLMTTEDTQTGSNDT